MFLIKHTDSASIRSFKLFANVWRRKETLPFKINLFTYIYALYYVSKIFTYTLYIYIYIMNIGLTTYRANNSVHRLHNIDLLKI